MKQVVAYARVSTDDQCLSVAGQFAAIKIAAEANGWHIIAEFTDQGVSGAIDPMERPQCKLALAMAKGLSCPVMVHRLDRLGRDHAHFVTLQKKFKFIEAEDVHGSGLVRNIKSLLAEEELIKIRQRTKDGLATLKVKAANGDQEAQAKIARRDAGREAAWAVGNGEAVKAKALNADNRARALEAELKACLYDGKPSYAAIAKCLNDKGLTTDRGSAFAPMTVSRLMARLGVSLPA
ncbi:MULTISPECIES: recombinase family protein [Pseudomonas]|uniref:recombinase family protein n=1 Tax=Pseudomonas TaxID=286 RepID=UPI0014743432|nr:MULTISPECIES: recombinase family protein [Pseudomonas]MCU0209590.1 recombinase family protein [Pseudomonas shahriarae]NMY22918.1 recombinase family protein [Pseudomonas sp. WS 5410]